MPAKKTTILAADDDPQLLRLITRNLQLEGYDVLAASDGLQALELDRMRISGACADLTLQLAIAGSEHGGKGGTRACQSLRIGDAARGAEDAQELVALAADAAKHAELLKDHGPGNDGKKEKKRENSPGNPTGLRKKILQIN